MSIVRWHLLCLALLIPGLWAQAPDEYKLESGDVIEVRFYYTPELSDKMQIRPDGHISLGLIGQVPATGKSVPELVKYLEDQYSKILKKPAISVQVIAFANRKVFIGGEVVRPGLIELVGEQTILGGILASGGVTRSAKRSHVLLVRRSATGVPETLRVAMETKGRPTPQLASMQLRPFDVVLVTESGISRVNRAVDQYVFRFIPTQLTLGFTYLLNAGVIF